MRRWWVVEVGWWWMLWVVYGMWRRLEGERVMARCETEWLSLSVEISGGSTGTILDGRGSSASLFARR